jgi:hypothetical protein
MPVLIAVNQALTFRTALLLLARLRRMRGTISRFSLHKELALTGSSAKLGRRQRRTAICTSSTTRIPLFSSGTIPTIQRTASQKLSFPLLPRQARGTLVYTASQHAPIRFKSRVVRLSATAAAATAPALQLELPASATRASLDPSVRPW